MYAPDIESAVTRRRYNIGEYEAAFLDTITGRNSIEYTFIIVVFEPGSMDPFLFVTSEKNSMWDPESPPRGDIGSHFFCVFDQERHTNFGSSTDWADAAKFEAAALRELEGRLGASAVVHN